MRNKEHYNSLGYNDHIEYYSQIKWEDTGYLSPKLSSEDTYPDYIQAEVSQSVEDIKAHMGKDTILFGFATDLHYATTRNHEVRMERMLNAYKNIAKETGSEIFLLGGDLTNEGCKEYKSDCYTALRKKFDSIRYFPANGNHDDGTIWDISYIDAPQSTNHLLPSERYELFYNHLEHENVRFGKERALYYYYNDTKTKTRFIALDTGDISYQKDENGKLIQSGQWTFAMSQKQVDWFVNDALSFDEDGWSVVLFMHSMTPPECISAHTARAKEKWYLDHIEDIADAYKAGKKIKKRYYSGEFELHVDADFEKGKKAAIIAFFAGDFHRDMTDATKGGIPKIFTANSVTYRGGASNPERNDADKSELLFDMVVVDKGKRIIHLTRVGCGDDRTIKY